jgi:hypothetical protein
MVGPPVKPSSAKYFATLNELVQGQLLHGALPDSVLDTQLPVVRFVPEESKPADCVVFDAPSATEMLGCTRHDGGSCVAGASEPTEPAQNNAAQRDGDLPTPEGH